MRSIRTAVVVAATVAALGAAGSWVGATASGWNGEAGETPTDIAIYDVEGGTEIGRFPIG